MSTEPSCPFSKKHSRKMRIEIIETQEKDLPVVNNLFRLYYYDLSTVTGWNCPENGLFEGYAFGDLSRFWKDDDKYAFVIRVRSSPCRICADRQHRVQTLWWIIISPNSLSFRGTDVKGSAHMLPNTYSIDLEESGKLCKPLLIKCSTDILEKNYHAIYLRRLRRIN